MKITDEQLYQYTMGVKMFQLVPAWIEKENIKEIFEAVIACINVVYKAGEQIKFDNTSDDQTRFSKFVSEFKETLEKHSIAGYIGLHDSAVRIGIGEYLTSKIKGKKYDDYYEYFFITETWL